MLCSEGSVIGGRYYFLEISDSSVIGGRYYFLEISDSLGLLASFPVSGLPFPGQFLSDSGGLLQGEGGVVSELLRFGVFLAGTLLELVVVRGPSAFIDQGDLGEGGKVLWFVG